MRSSRTFSFLMVLAAAATCNAAAAEAPSTSVRLSILSGHPVVSQVFINGEGPYRFLLDTGAQTNQIETHLADKLGLTATFQVEVDTAAGSIRTKGGRVRQVALGAAEAGDQEFLFADLDGLHALSQDLRGILGQEFLAHFDYTLDFHDHRVTFGNPPPSGTQVPVRLIDSRMAVRTSLGELILDSGSDALILFGNSTKLRSGQILAASGLRASVSAESVTELRIGDRLYHRVKAAMDGHTGVKEAGLLPASLFQSIFISNSGGYVVVNPRARR